MKLIDLLSEKLDRDGFYHTSVENGEFKKSHLIKGNDKWLHDLDKKNPEGKDKLVTFQKERDARKAQKKFGGTVVKITPMGTFRLKL